MIDDASTSVWIASLMGPVILALGFFMLTSPVALQQTTKGLLSNAPLILVSGILAMLAGLSIVNTHNIWRLEWAVIITLFGWALLVGGTLRVIAPHLVAKAGGAMVDAAGMTRVAGGFWWLMGLFLTVKGYA